MIPYNAGVLSIRTYLRKVSRDNVNADCRDVQIRISKPLNSFISVSNGSKDNLGIEVVGQLGKADGRAVRLEDCVHILEEPGKRCRHQSGGTAESCQDETYVSPIIQFGVAGPGTLRRVSDLSLISKTVLHT